MQYVVFVTGKYLQMMSAYSISKEDPDQVADHFEQFNCDYEEMCKAFKEVTSQTFQAGQKVETLRPVAPVKPIQRESKPELGLSDNERVKLQQFLEMHQLNELLPIFLKEGVALHDVLEMTDREMKNLGVSAYSLRKRLARVIEDHHQSSQEETTVVPEDQVQSEVLRAWQVKSYSVLRIKQQQIMRQADLSYGRAQGQGAQQAVWHGWQKRQRGGFGWRRHRRVGQGWLVGPLSMV